MGEEKEEKVARGQKLIYRRQAFPRLIPKRRGTSCKTCLSYRQWTSLNGRVAEGM